VKKDDTKIYEFKNETLGIKLQLVFKKYKRVAHMGEFAPWESYEEYDIPQPLEINWVKIF
jgi:hypothetical protein